MSNESNVETVVTTVTPYAAAKAVNVALKAAGYDKVVPPQMMYNYTTQRVNKGKEPFIKMHNGGLVVEDLQRWLTEYVAKLNKVTQVITLEA